MYDILRNFDAVEKSVAECPPEMDAPVTEPQAAPSINIQLDDTSQMAKLLQALKMVQDSSMGEEEVEESDVEITDEVWQQIAQRRKELVDDEGMEPEEALEQAAEEMGVDPMELEDWLAMNVEGYDNEPEEEYMDLDAVLPSGDDLHKKKTMHKAQAMGDNPMAMESIKDRLWQALEEKKAKPDFLDMDKDGDKKEPMKKAIKDKKAKKGKMPPQFKK